MVRWRLQDYFPIFPKFVKQGGNQFIVPASIVQIEKVDDKGPHSVIRSYFNSAGGDCCLRARLASGTLW